MKREEDQELWDLLGHSPEPTISPFFARNVLRKVRESGSWGNLRRWFSIRRLLPAASVAVGLIAVLFLRTQTPGIPLAAETESDLFANVDPQDYEVIADLSDLLASDDSSSVEETILR